jgi:hypothetical protein
VTAAYSECLDSNCVLLRTSSNYKGKEEGGRMVVRTCFAPPVEAFYALPQLIAPETPGNRSSNSGSGSQGEASLGGSVTVVTRDNYLSGKRDCGESMGKRGHDESGKSVKSVLPPLPIASILTKSTKLSLEQSLKVLLLSAEQVHSFASDRSFNNILDALTTYELHLQEVIVVPEAGFVILAKQVRPVVNVVLNIAHHPAVGCMEAIYQHKLAAAARVGAGAGAVGVSAHSNYPTTYRLPSDGSLPRPLPYIIGHVAEQRSGSEMVVDIVIPTAVMMLIVQDTTGDLREEASWHRGGATRLYCINACLCVSSSRLL